MQKIKILFIGYGTNLGGIETFLYNLVKNANFKEFEKMRWQLGLQMKLWE